MSNKDIIPQFVQLLKEHDCVREWLYNRPYNTRKNYGSYLAKFCLFAKITPNQFQEMKRKQARDLAWSYIRQFQDKPSIQTLVISALKSFYRNKDGDTLPFDSRRGGKHYFNGLKRKRLATEHIPSPDDVYKIVDCAKRLRDKAIFLVLFQSGIRVNGLCRLTYGMVRNQLEQRKTPLRLRITSEIDTKLEGYRLNFYDTFIGKEAIDVLHNYCIMQHKNSSDESPLFVSTKNKKALKTSGVWEQFRNSVARAGFPKNRIRVHTLRKSFKNQVRKSNLGRDYAELLMGHVLGGSQENYVNRQSIVEDLEKVYMKINFSRSKPSQRQVSEKMRQEVTHFRQERNVDVKFLIE